MDPIKLEDLDDQTRQQLIDHRFDLTTFERLRADLAAGAFGPERNRLAGAVTSPGGEDLVAWPTEPALRALGQEAIAAGQVGFVVLNGGMATRFGGVVKGVVEVHPGRSFLDLRLDGLRRAGPVPVFLMNSFATDRATREHLSEHDDFGLSKDRLHQLTQGISMRLTPSGELFRDAQGLPSLYAPGHGDLFEALAASEAFSQFVSGGGRVVMVGNVDNLGATLVPEVIGAHLHHGRPVSVEVADRWPGDSGGAPALVDGHLQIVEGFRFPDGFDLSTIPVFNTNTLVLDTAAVRRHPLTWFRADKSIEGHPVVQFERLMGEVTAFVDSTYIKVSREGDESRFLPVKTPEDLKQLREMKLR